MGRLPKPKGIRKGRKKPSQLPTQNANEITPQSDETVQVPRPLPPAIEENLPNRIPMEVRPRSNNVPYVKFADGTFGCPMPMCPYAKSAYKSKDTAYQHLLKKHRQVMICYRWAAGPKYYEETSTYFAMALADGLARNGQEPWLDRRHIPIDAQRLSDTVGKEMERRKLVIICIGERDLERCKADDDFFRWEIERARTLERAGRLKVVLVLHGIANMEELIKASRRAGAWGREFNAYLVRHYLLFARTETMDTLAERILKSLREF